MASDLLALCLLKSQYELELRISPLGIVNDLGSNGFWGPHAFCHQKKIFKGIFLEESFGVSIDAHGNRALRMALQTVNNTSAGKSC